MHVNQQRKPCRVAGFRFYDVFISRLDRHMKKIHGTNLDSKENCQWVMKRLFSEEEQQEQKDSFSAKIAQIIDSLKLWKLRLVEKTASLEATNHENINGHKAWAWGLHSIPFLLHFVRLFENYGLTWGSLSCSLWEILEISLLDTISFSSNSSSRPKSWCCVNIPVLFWGVCSASAFFTSLSLGISSKTRWLLLGARACQLAAVWRSAD